jgi:hypothetical protein
MLVRVPIRCCGQLPSRRRPAGAAFFVCVVALSGVFTGNAVSRMTAPNLVLATAVVLNADKEPVAGASVYAYYAPETATKFKAPPLATAVTDDGGRFTLTAKYTSTLKKLSAPNGGWLNVDLFVASGPLTLYVGAPRMFGPSGWIGPQVGGSVDLGTLILAPGAPGVGGKGRTTSVHRPRAPRTSAQVCFSLTTELQTAVLWTIVGELHTFNGPATFTYGTHANTTVSEPSSTSSTGPWSAAPVTTGAFANPLASGASIAWSNSAGIGNSTLFSGFRYRKVEITNPCLATKWVVKPKAWVGKTLRKTAGDPSTRCTVGAYASSPNRLPRPAGSTFTRGVSASTAYRYPRGVNESPLGVAGPGGSAVAVFSQSDYGPYVKAHWTFPVAGSLCGDTGPPASSLRIFAGG